MFNLRDKNGNLRGACNSISHLLRVVEHSRMRVIVEDTDGSLFSMEYRAIERNTKEGTVYNVLNRADLSVTEFLLERV